MKPLLPVLALALLAVPASAQDAPRPAMTLEQQMALRCSAVFAIVAGEQARGEPSAQAYPPMSERGREFFVRSSARLMDELRLSREQMQAALRAEVEALQTRRARSENPAAVVDSLMQPCLSALDSSGL